MSVTYFIAVQYTFELFRLYFATFEKMLDKYSIFKYLLSRLILYVLDILKNI